MAFVPEQQLSGFIDDIKTIATASKQDIKSAITSIFVKPVVNVPKPSPKKKLAPVQKTITTSPTASLPSVFKTKANVTDLTSSDKIFGLNKKIVYISGASLVLFLILIILLRKNDL